MKEASADVLLYPENSHLVFCHLIRIKTEQNQMNQAGCQRKSA